MSHPLIIFMHIPKTAGRTLRAIIRRQYRPEEVCTTNRQEREPFSAFTRLTAAEQARLRVVQGHFAYGLHEHTDRPVLYVTMLRQPAARAISYYRFIRDNPHHTHHAAANALGLTGFVRERVSKGIDNGQLRYLAAAEDAPFGECTEEMLALALQRLEERFIAVGLVEAFDDSILLMRQALGWRLPVYKPVNVSKHQVRREELSEEVLEALAAYNQLDQRLYDYACRRLAAAKQAAGWRFAWDRRRLAWMNQVLAWRTS